MAEEQPSLQIDTDWKKQAQEEKRRLAEQQRAQPDAPGLLTPGSAAAAAGAAPIGVAPPPAAAAAATSPGSAARGRRELPPASFTTLVNSLMTQAMLYLGEVPTQSGPILDLDRAKHQIDLLTVIEEKTRNNLDEEEQRTIDAVLYELRMRFVSTASQYL